MFAFLMSVCLFMFGGDGPKQGPVMVNNQRNYHYRPAIFYGLVIPVSYRSSYTINYIGNIAVINEYRVGYNMYGVPVVNYYYVHYRYR